MSAGGGSTAPGLGRGQRHTERRPATGRARDSNVAPHASDRAERDGETEPGTALALRREEGIEDARHVLWRNAHARVDDFDQGVAVFIGARRHPHLVAVGVALWNGLRSVDQQVQKHLS